MAFWKRALCPNCGQKATGLSCPWCGYPLMKGMPLAEPPAEKHLKKLTERKRKEARQEGARIRQEAKKKAEREGAAIMAQAKSKVREAVKEVSQQAREEAEREAAAIIAEARESVEQESPAVIAKATEKRLKVRDTTKAKAIPESTDAKSSELYTGQIELVLLQPLDLDQVRQFEECLKQVEDLSLVWSGGSVDEGMLITIQAQSPMPLINILKEMPPVEKVGKKGKKIAIRLRAPASS